MLYTYKCVTHGILHLRLLNQGHFYLWVNIILSYPVHSFHTVVNPETVIYIGLTCFKMSHSTFTAWVDIIDLKFEKCTGFFLLLNAKENILRNVGNQTVAGTH